MSVDLYFTQLTLNKEALQSIRGKLNVESENKVVCYGRVEPTFYWPPNGNNGYTTTSVIEDGAGEIMFSYPELSEEAPVNEEGEKSEDADEGTPWGVPTRSKDMELTSQNLTNFLNSSITVQILARPASDEGGDEAMQASYCETDHVVGSFNVNLGSLFKSLQTEKDVVGSYAIDLPKEETSSSGDDATAQEDVAEGEEEEETKEVAVDPSVTVNFGVRVNENLHNALCNGRLLSVTNLQTELFVATNETNDTLLNQFVGSPLKQFFIVADEVTEFIRGIRESKRLLLTTKGGSEPSSSSDDLEGKESGENENEDGKEADVKEEEKEETVEEKDETANEATGVVSLTKLLIPGSVSLETDTFDVGCVQSQFVVQLSEPLISKPPSPPEPELKIADIIPPRPKVKPVKLTAEDSLKNSVLEISSNILDEIYRMFEAESSDMKDLSKEQRKKKLLHVLNTKGQYSSFREQMKKSIVRLVKEQFTQDQASNHELFLTNLYAKVMENIHLTLNAQFEAALEKESTPKTTVPTYDVTKPSSPLAKRLRSSQTVVESKVAPTSEKGYDVEYGLKRLLNLAIEAEVNGNGSVADSYYRDRISLVKEKSPSNVQPWIEYAQYLGRAGLLTAAKQCTTEVIAIDQENCPALCLFGALLYEEIKRSADANVNIMEASIALQTAYELVKGQGDENLAKVSMGLYSNLLTASGRGDEALILEAPASAFRAAGKFLVTNGLYQTGLEILDREKSVTETQLVKEDLSSDEYTYLKAKFLIQKKEYTNAESLLHENIDVTDSGEAWALLGLCFYEMKQFEAALDAYKRAEDKMSKEGKISAAAGVTVDDLTSLRMRYAAALMDEKCYAPAQELYLRAAKEYPTATAWKGAGSASLKLGDIEQAELAFSEANLYDNMNAEIWCYLCIVCKMQDNRDQEGETCFKMALKLGKLYAENKNYETARLAYERALSLNVAGSLKWTLLNHLGTVLEAQNLFEEALAKYKMVSNDELCTDKKLLDTANGRAATIRDKHGLK
eukprot:g2946.t1